MRRFPILASLAAVGAAALGKRSIDRRIAQWDQNLDTCDGDPIGMPDGTLTSVTAADGAVLRGLDAGEGPTVLLIHCWTGFTGFYGPVARRLVDAGYRVVAIDQRGHGTSDRGTAVYSPDILASDLKTWVTELDLHDVVVSGHSMGGLTTMAFATQFPELAEARFRGLVLIATLASTITDPRLPNVKIDLGPLLPMMERGMRHPHYGLLGLLRVFGTNPARVQLEAARTGFANTDAKSRRDAATMMSDFDLRPGLPDISIPTVVVAGSHDQLTWPSTNQEIADLIPGARIEMLPGLGHMLPWEAPDQITDFIVQAHKPNA